MNRPAYVSSDLQKTGVLLLSGGLDSATLLAELRAQNIEISALTFRYGQRHVEEIAAAQTLVRQYGVRRFRIVNLDASLFSSSALIDSGDETESIKAEITAGNLPTTYVPARNTLFLAYALAWAENLGVFDIYLGANLLDRTGYPDCRPAFISAFENVANLGTRAAQGGQQHRILAPLMQWTKAQIIARGAALGLSFDKTHSCYEPRDGLACGTCDACVLRRDGFCAANIADPTPYAELCANVKAP